MNMRRKLVLAMTLMIIVVGMLGVTLKIQRVEASETIYIKANGSIDPPTANITSVDNVTYFLTDNINESIVVERDNIVVDGANFTVQGTGTGTGIYLNGTSNVTIRNMEIKEFENGIWLYWSSNNNVSGNDITNNENGIYLYVSSFNTISRNNITNNHDGIRLSVSSNNNSIYHNNFVNNTKQVNHEIGGNNVWDNGYPSGGNYWNEYTGVDVKSGPNQDQPSSDGIGDGPYAIEAYDQDNYPLMYPWGAPPPPSHNLTIYSSPTGVTFTVDDVSRTCPWSGNYSEGASVSLLMPENHTVGEARYYWNQWSDGVPSRSRTVIMNTNITLTAHYTGPYYHLTFNITFEEEMYNITVFSNSSITNFNFNQTLKQISFNVTGSDGTLGFCNLTIPNSLVQGLWQSNFTVLVDGEEPIMMSNWTDGTYTYIYFTYQHSTHKVEITPEFPTWTSMLLILIMLTVAIAICKRRLQTSIH